MVLKKEDIKKIAQLSKIEVGEHETLELQTDLNNILLMIDQLKKINTESILEMSHPLSEKLMERGDDAIRADISKITFANAPNEKNGYFLVPKIID